VHTPAINVADNGMMLLAIQMWFFWCTADENTVTWWEDCYVKGIQSC
jgi:hypothetical protein